MARPKDTLWTLEEHSKAKHEILRRYLGAWLPIMSRYNGRIVLVDGFAGPGRYSGGEDGSPLIMLKAFLEHDFRARMKAELVYLFIEERKDRAEFLESEILKLDLPDNVTWGVEAGNFQEIFGAEIKQLQDEGKELAPTFAFIDPFGYTDAPMDLTASILEFRRCEVLIYVPFPHIIRFISSPALEPALNALFGTDAWKAAIYLEGEERRQFLHDLFREQLLRQGEVRFVRSFEIITKRGSGGYHLFFGTGHETGLKAMKTAMWSVDPTEGRSFRDTTGSDQLVLMEPDPDLSPLDSMLREHFEGEPFSIGEAETFTLTATPYLPKHVRKGSLVPAEKAKELEILTERSRKNTYPEGTRMRFIL